MAEKNINTANKEPTETIFIPLSGNPDEPETEFFSVNERTFYVRKGEPVEVPASVADVYRNNEREKRRLRAKARAAER